MERIIHCAFEFDLGSDLGRANLNLEDWFVWDYFSKRNLDAFFVIELLQSVVFGFGGNSFFECSELIVQGKIREILRIAEDESPDWRDFQN